MTCECGKPKRKRQEGCDECQRIEAEWRRSEKPSEQVCAVLRYRNEWVLASEIAEALDIPTPRVSWNLAYLVECGRALMRWERGIGMVYRIRRAA